MAQSVAKHFGLPKPTVKAGRMPSKGLQAIPLWGGAAHGLFTVNRWALYGKYRRSTESLEYNLLEGCAWWLYSHRHHILKTSHTVSACEKEVFTFWYGPEKAAKITESKAAAARQSLIALIIWLGIPLLISLLLWAS
jgi:hypothetical protein